MSKTPSLRTLFCQQMEDSSSSFSQGMYRYFTSQTIPSHEILEECKWEEPFLSEEKWVDNWKKLLALNLFCDLTQLYQTELTQKIRQFERYPWNQSSQYCRSLVALNHALAKMPIPEVGPHLLESGAALVELNEYYPWLSLPYTPYHFEFGIFLALLALSTKRESLYETVGQIARWQVNTLDIHGKPLAGLFVREHDRKALDHLCLCYLLFLSAASVIEPTPFAAISEATMKQIQIYLSQKNEMIHPLFVLIEQWLSQHKILSHKELELSENIYDPSTSLVGYRSPSQHIVCTLHGERTGLGCFRHGDIEIVTYGPQHLPVAECQGFGIEGNALSDHGIRRSMIERRRESFILKGCTRLVNQPSTSFSQSETYRGIWLEVVQEFKKPHFYLKTSFLGLDGWDSIAFSFFIKAARCRIATQILRPLLLEQYEGETKTILLESKDHFIELRPLTFKGNMQVIPLAGENNFWGADFLITYFMTPEQRHYQWHIGPPYQETSSLKMEFPQQLQETR